MSGDVIGTGATAAETASETPVHPGTDTVGEDQAQPKSAGGTESPQQDEPRQDMPQQSGTRQSRPGVDQADTGASHSEVRRPAGPAGRARGGGMNPVLEPLFKTVRATHPKADVRLIERAYEVAAHGTPGRSARAATRTSPTRSRWPRSSPSSA